MLQSLSDIKRRLLLGDDRKKPQKNLKVKKIGHLDIKITVK